ncbi:MAG: TetR/AcrR family transcriptional regulator [Firmicutes bacterium]|nr:TetR/AcrR family transcriptional regulator [Bacillota bacterium]
MARRTAPTKDPTEAESKARLLAAAERLFAEQGYAATSIGDISESAGVNRALIYYYFKNKRDLYWAVIREGVEQMSVVMAAAAVSGRSIREKLGAFVDGYYRLLLKRQDTVRIAFREITGSGEKLGLSIKGCFGENLAQLQAIIREGIASGELRPLDPEMTAHSVLGMINVFMTQQLVTERTFPPDLVVRHTLDLLCNGALGARSAGQPEESSHGET